MFGLVEGVPQFEYRPDTGDFRGYDSFEYRVHDGYNSSNVAKIEFIVPNTPPIARDFDYSPAVFDLDEQELYSILSPSGSTAVTGLLLRHPRDLDGDTLLASVGEFTDEFGNRFGAPQHGTVILAADGNFTYTPHPGYHVFGVDRFAYRLSDGYESSEIAWVTVRQALGRGVPRSNSYSVMQGERLLVHTATLLANDKFESGLTASPFAYQVRITENGDRPGETRLFRGDNDAPVHRGDEVPAGIGLYFLAPNQPGFWHLEYEFLFLNPLDATQVTNLVASDRGQLLIQVTEFLDFDGDGVSDATEAFLTRDGAPRGDGNNDGIEDYFQPNVATFSTALVGGDVITMEVGGGLSLFNVHRFGGHLPADQPPNAQFPLGFFSFQITGLLPSGRAQVTIWLPPGMMLNGYYKFSFPGWRTVAGSDPPLYATGNDGWYDFGFDGRTGAVITPSSIVLFLEDNARGDADHAADGVITDPGGPALITSAPRVTSVVINDGSAQRSKVNSLTVTFDTLVTVDPGAFELRRHGTKKPIDTKFTLSEIDGRTVALLTFKGAWVQYGTLKDGNYTLTIRAAKIRDATGDLLDGDGDGIAGGNHVDEFFRRFGDTDGDGDVDAADKGVFLSAFGKRAGNPGYLWYLDFNCNGRIGAEDLAHFILTKVRHSNRP